MSELLKDKSRASRRARTYAAAERQLVIHRQHVGSDKSRGYFKKQHAMDCGNPRCGVCSSHRGTPTVKDLSAFQLAKLDFAFLPEALAA